MHIATQFSDRNRCSSLHSTEMDTDNNTQIQNEVRVQLVMSLTVDSRLAVRGVLGDITNDEEEDAE